MRIAVDVGLAAIPTCNNCHARAGERVSSSVYFRAMMNAHQSPRIAADRDAILGQLTGRLGVPPDACLEVGCLERREVRAILAAKLAWHAPLWSAAPGGGRRVTEAQMAALEAAAAEGGDGGGGPTVLQLKLLAAEAARWRSFDRPPPEMGAPVDGLIKRLFARLEVGAGR